MKAELSALAGLARDERRILRQAWLALLLADATLRLSSLPNAQRLLAPRTRPASAAGSGSMPPNRLAQLVDIAARHHIRPMSCLRRSLVLQALLLRQGWATDLRIGVQRDRSKLLAHAWLEQAGQPLFEAPEIRDRFTPLLRPGEAL